MKQEFKMTQDEMDNILQINKDTGPVMLIGGVRTGMDKQKNINKYWDGLADKYGFNTETVEPSSRGDLFFLAEPAMTKVQREEDALSQELKRGKEIATELIEHLKRMGAAETKIPITHKGDTWNVTVECITDKS